MLKTGKLYWLLILVIAVLAVILFAMRGVYDEETAKLAGAGFETLLFFSTLTLLTTAMYEMGYSNGLRKKQEEKTESP